MPKSIQDRAIEPFFTTKDVGKGSGLGLPSVYGFAKQSGGGVTIESELGVGTKISIYFPKTEIKSLPSDLPATLQPLASTDDTRE